MSRANGVSRQMQQPSCRQGSQSPEKHGSHTEEAATNDAHETSNPPLVTVMIPTFNQARVLPRAIESALAQDHNNLEVVISDDASPDETAKVVATYASDTRVRYHRNEHNLGRVGNYRHTLSRLAKGDYALNLDGDDWLCDSTFISQATSLMDHRPDVSLVFGNAWYYQEKNNSFHKPEGYNLNLLPINDGNELFLKYATEEVWIPHLAAVYRRQLALDLGFYSLDIIGSDSDAILRALLGQKVGFIDNYVAAWRLHEVNATKSLSVSQRLDNLLSVESPYLAARKKGQIDKRKLDRWRKRMLTRLTNEFVRMAIFNGSYLAAIHFLMTVSLKSPAVGATVVSDTANRAVDLFQQRLRRKTRGSK